MRFPRSPKIRKTSPTNFRGSASSISHTDDPASLIAPPQKRAKPLFLLCETGRVPLFNVRASHCLTRFWVKSVPLSDSSAYIYIYIYMGQRIYSSVKNWSKIGVSVVKNWSKLTVDKWSKIFAYFLYFYSVLGYVLNYR